MKQKTHVRILCVSDASYFRRARSLAASLSANFPDATLHCYLINVEPSAEERIREKFPRCEFEHDSRKFPSEQARRSYCANIRVNVLLKLLERGEETVLYVDADSVVRGSLDALISLIQKNDIVALRRDESETHLAKFATGVIGVRNTPAAKTFLKTWSEAIEGKLFEWFGDQVSFSQAFEQMGSALKLASLPSEFIDWEYLPNSPIWVGKGQRKFDDIYQREENYYLNTFQELDI